MGVEGDVYVGYDKYVGYSVVSFCDKFWFMLLLIIFILIWSGMIQYWFDYIVLQFLGLVYILVVFGMIVYFYGGLLFFCGGYYELRNCLLGMMMLILFVIIVVFFYSVLVMFGVVEGLDLWWELVMLVVIMLFGYWIEMCLINQVQGVFKEFVKLLFDMVVWLDEVGIVKEVFVVELKCGDLLFIRFGVSIFVDGVVKEGISVVNEVMIIGEFKLMDKLMGDWVIVGIVNGQGLLCVEVMGIGDEIVFVGIMWFVEQVQMLCLCVQVLVDWVVFYFMIIVIVFVVVIVIVWLFFG